MFQTKIAIKIEGEKNTKMHNIFKSFANLNETKGFGKVRETAN